MTRLLSFRRFALITTALTYFLIFVGGLVRVSGAGLGCPDWPKCFGRWIPPTSLEQLPPEFDPSTFNITLAWIEYVNRLIGVILGLFILTLAIRALLHHRKHKRIWVPAVTALILTGIQGWQGSVVVAMGLDPDVVNIHLYMALVIVGVLIYLCQQTYYLDPERNDEYLPRYPGGFGITLWAIFLLVLSQVFLGSQVRGGFEALRQTLQFIPDISVIQLMGPGLRVHLWLGIIMAILSGIGYFQIRLYSEKVSKLMAGLMYAVMGLVIIQSAMGMAMLRIGLPPLIQLFHLWTSSILYGMSLMQIIAHRRYRRLQFGS